MRIAVIGTGAVGAALGPRFGKLGHEVMYGSREPAGEKVQQVLARTGGRSSAATHDDAVHLAEVVVLATPWAATKDVVQSLDLDGKVLLDCTNPLREDLTGSLATEYGSGAQAVAAWAPGARVVKVFSTVGSNIMENPAFGSSAADMYICGDDDEAKGLSSSLAQSMGFNVIDCGGLDASGLLENLAALWVRLAYPLGHGREIAFKLLKR